MKDKTVYGYIPETGEYYGPEIARVCPVTGKDYIYPAHTTESKPPKAKAGQAIVLKNGAWAYVADHRGKALYDPETRQHLGCVQNLGDIPAGTVLELEPLPEIEPEPSELEVLIETLKGRGVITDAHITATRVAVKQRAAK